jgi:hypothetical protein
VGQVVFARGPLLFCLEKEIEKIECPKPKADVESGASLNFPFGCNGELTIRIQLNGILNSAMSLRD